jgi:phage shock protein A
VSALEKIRILAGWQGPLDLEDAVDQIEARIDQLRAKLAAVTQRAEAAEAERDVLRAECEEWRENYAALEAVAIAAERERQAAEAARAAVPRDALCRVLLTGYRTDAQIAADSDAIDAWLAQQPEVQP